MDSTTNVSYIFSATDNASAAIVKITQCFQQLQEVSKQTEKLKVGTEQVKASAKQTENIARSTTTIKTNLYQSLAKVVSLRKAMSFITSSLERSSAWTENLHMFEIAFGNASSEAYNFAMTISKSFGVSQNEIIRYTALFNQMASAIGLTEQTCQKMSYALTALGYDIASLYNLSIESAMEKLRAGIAGQTKPLRQLGMDITAQTLTTYLQNTMGLTNITAKMVNQSDKMLLRTIVIMSQATNTYGDMAETINTFANQVKVMQGSIDNFKLAVGDLIKNFAAPIITAFSGFIISLTAIIRAFVPQEAETDIENIASAIGDVNEELDETTNKMGLLSFDKFNALNKSNSNSSTSDLTSLLENEFYAKYEEYMNGFNKAMQTIDNNANKVAIAITQWIFPLSTFNEETGEIEANISKVNSVLVALFEILKLIVAIALAKKLVALLKVMQTWALQAKLMSMEAKTLGTSMVGLNSSLKAMSGLFAVILIKGIMDVIQNWDNMNTVMKVVTVTILAVVAALYLYSSGMGLAIIQTVKFAAIALANVVKVLGVGFIKAIKVAIGWLASFSASTWVCIGAFAVLTAGITVLALNWDNMGSWQKVITIFAAISAAAIAAAVAIGVFHTTWTLGIGAAAIAAGITLVTGSILSAKSATKFADGGYPDKGTYFIAGEAGPEVVANVGGGQSGVMNLQQFEEACYRGTLRAIGASGLDNISTSKGNITLNVNGKEFARGCIHDFAEEADRQKIKFN